MTRRKGRDSRRNDEDAKRGGSPRNDEDARCDTCLALRKNKPVGEFLWLHNIGPIIPRCNAVVGQIHCD